MKACKRCGVEKALSAFPGDKRQADGRRNVCKDCSREDPAANRARASAWRKANPERALERARAWAKANPERRRLIAKRHAARKYRADGDRLRAEARKRMRALWLSDPKGRRAVAKRARQKWIATDPEGYRLSKRLDTAIRRSRKRNATIGPVDYERIKARDGMRCHICRKAVADKDLEFDHVIPLAAGGDHAELNIAVSHARCNRSKNAKRLTLF